MKKEKEFLCLPGIWSICSLLSILSKVLTLFSLPHLAIQQSPSAKRNVWIASGKEMERCLQMNSYAVLLTKLVSNWSPPISLKNVLKPHGSFKYVLQLQAILKSRQKNFEDYNELKTWTCGTIVWCFYWKRFSFPFFSEKIRTTFHSWNLVVLLYRFGYLLISWKYACCMLCIVLLWVLS